MMHFVDHITRQDDKIYAESNNIDSIEICKSADKQHMTTKFIFRVLV